MIWTTLAAVLGLASAEPADAWTYGRALFEDLRCGACHDAGPGVSALEAPRLDRVGSRARPSWLRAWLRDPHGTRPGTNMPDVLAGLPTRERAGALDELVHFLASLGGPFEPSPTPLSAHALEHGRQLYHTIGCVACHDAHEVASDLAEPLWGFAASEDVESEPRSRRSLAHLPAKTNAAALAELLLDPLSFHPDGRMPSLRLTADEARDIATYLTTVEVLEGRLDLAFGPGLAYRYVEGEPGDELVDYTSVEPDGAGTWGRLDELPPHREDEYGFLFEGFVDLPRDGLWTFATTSDDGSRLWIDGEMVVDNGGDHAPLRKEGEVDLSAGRHALTITFYERTGGEELAVEWSGPGVETAVIPPDALAHWILPERAPPEPFELDPELAELGRERYGELGCVACHPLDGLHAPPGARVPDLAELGASGGCLDPRGSSGAPRFPLAAHERAELAAFLADPRRGVDSTPAGELERTLTRLDCYACHERGGRGGPDERTRAYFVGEEGVDLGDEGRFPPKLDHVGWKLKTEWLREFLVEPETVRPYLRTRMPVFGEEHVGELAELFFQVDRWDLHEFFVDRGEQVPEHLPQRPEDVEDGARLAGTKGLGCVQCHVYGPHGSTGIRSVDLTTMTDRIDSRWFRQLLLDPKSIGMNSRMPEFLVDGGRSPVTDMFDGDAERQVEALWAALSLGEAMPLPEGLLISTEAFELTPVDGPRMISVFLKDVGPRVLLVGSPSRIHYAYDVASCRLVAAWTGAFFNARGTWYERAGALEEIGEDAIEFPQGLPFVVLAEVESHATDGGPQGSELRHRALGRRFDGDGRPSFRYALVADEDREPDALVTESIATSLGESGPTLQRCFEIESRDDVRGRLALRIASGTLVGGHEGTWNVDGVRVRTPCASYLSTTRSSPSETILVPIEGTTLVEIEYSW